MSSLARLGRALTLPFVRAGTAYNNAAKKWPGSVGIITTVAKTSAADAFAQTIVEGKDTIDWNRNAMFSIFGFAYLGCWQYVLYAKLFPKITPTITATVGKVATAPALVFLDQCIHHPLMYFPAFYLLRGAMEGRDPRYSLEKCKNEMWENLKALWAVWVPAQLVNFSVVPLHLRVPFVAGISFLWCVILSVLRGALEQHVPQSHKEHAAAVAAAGVTVAAAAATTAAAATATAVAAS
mmetsp:Transcript_7269/g.15867  ORF Transcript_7269/g.15867 Transcript_7269/m.15867 type:complete len:238 (+) Transcript_7269:230-943(+)